MWSWKIPQYIPIYIPHPIISRGILSVPQNIVMDLNNVMKLDLKGKHILWLNLKPKKVARC